MRPDELELLRVAFRSLSVLDYMELLAVLRADFLVRGKLAAAEYVSRAAGALALESLSSEAPSDNGPRNPGDNEAGA